MRTPFGPLNIVYRILAARLGEVRALEEVYHLRSVWNFVAVFAATIVVPGIVLTWYGFAGIRAEQRAGTAEVSREAEIVSNALYGDIESYFQSFENATLNRMKSGRSLTSSLAEMSDVLRVVFVFDNEGRMVAPFVRDLPSDPSATDLFAMPRWQEAWGAELGQDWARAADRYAALAREAPGLREQGHAVFARGRVLAREGDAGAAELAWNEVLRQYPTVRDPWGFRLGDLARLRLGEQRLAREPAVGAALLRQLVEDLLSGAMVMGQGGEPAVDRRALDLLAGKVDPDWLARTRGRLGERSDQLYWSSALLEELDRLGTRGRLFRTEFGVFYYWRTEQALWVTTSTDDDQYLFALDLPGLVAQLGVRAERAAGPDSEVRAILVAPSSSSEGGALSRRTLSRWLDGWAIEVLPRDPEALAARQNERWRRGVGIILLSAVMISVGLVLTARLLRRELAAAREKSDFAARVSHELRSPLTQIRLKAEALQLGLATTDASRDQHYDVIVRESERLSRLIDNMLDFSAIERGLKKYTMRPGDLGQTVGRAVESALVAMEMRGMHVDVEIPEDLPPVSHDPEAVSQVVTNLLSNAAKYGRDAGWIGVRVSVESGEVRVTISDRGIGIDPQEQGKIFQEYYRSLDPRARQRKGTGLGLTIVKYIVEAHDGRVTLESAIGSGSTFTLHFPVRPPRADAHP